MKSLKQVIRITHRSSNCTLEVRDSEKLVLYQGLKFPCSQMTFLGENIQLLQMLNEINIQQDNDNLLVYPYILKEPRCISHSHLNADLIVSFLMVKVSVICPISNFCLLHYISTSHSEYPMSWVDTSYHNYLFLTIRCSSSLQDVQDDHFFKNPFMPLFDVPPMRHHTIYIQ